MQDCFLKEFHGLSNCNLFHNKSVIVLIPLRSPHIHQLAPHSVDSRVLSLEHRQLTRSHVHVTGDDGAELIAGKTGIDLGMHFLAIVLSTEGGENQFAIG